MTTWLLHIIGISDEIIKNIDKATLAFQRPIMLWIGLVLLIPISVFFYYRQRNSLGAAPPALGITLVIIRVLIFGLLFIVLASPYLKVDYKIDEKPIVGILMDHSASMQLPAGPYKSEKELTRVAQASGYVNEDGRIDAEIRKALTRISRAKLAQTILNNLYEKFGKVLEDKFDVRYYAFGRDAEPIKMEAGDPPTLPEPPVPGENTTHIGDAIGKVLDESGGASCSGIIILSDGQNTGGKSPLDMAERAESMGVPIYSVAVGSSNIMHDVSILEVFTSGMASIGDMAQVSVMVGSQGLDGKLAILELWDGEKLLCSKDLILQSTEQQQIDLIFEAKEEGMRHLKVKIPPLSEEPDYLKDNNIDTALIRVSADKIRVLYLEGLPRWDFRFLKNAMRRDHGLSGRIMPEPDIYLEAEIKRQKLDKPVLPATEDQLGNYHLVMIGDASPIFINPEFVRMLSSAVREQGVGLIVMAGPLYMPHAYDKEFLEMLPVKLHPNAGGIEAPVSKPFRIKITPAGAINAAMRFYDDYEQNENVWNQFLPYYWCAAAKRPAAGATVLAWNPNVGGSYSTLPLIAVHNAGRGRVMFVGTDSTWLWRKDAADRFFYKFWGQAIRFVARSDWKNTKNSSINLMPPRSEPNQPVQIELHAFKEDGTPRTKRKLTVHVIGANTTRSVTLTASKMAKGRYTGTVTVDQPGEYRVVFNPGENLKLAEANLLALKSSEEIRRTGINYAGLDLLASVSGGRSVELLDLTSILGYLKGEAKSKIVHREATIWDNWLVLLLIALLYSTDVGLRRFTGLA